MGEFILLLQQFCHLTLDGLHLRNGLFSRRRRVFVPVHLFLQLFHSAPRFSQESIDRIDFRHMVSDLGRDALVAAIVSHRDIALVHLDIISDLGKRRLLLRRGGGRASCR